MKLFIYFSLIIGFASFSYGQQEPTFTHYTFNALTINPAFAGHKELLSITALNRARWLNFPGSPRTQNLTVHSILKTKSLGMGFSFLNDSKGPFQGTGIDIDIAYRMPLGEGRLSFGLKGGVRFISTRLQSEIVTVDQGDAVFQNDVISQPLPNFGFGILYSLNDFYVGISVPRSLKNKLNTLITNGNSFEERNYYMMLGGSINLNKSKSVKLKPSFFVKVTESTLLQFDANFLFYFNDKFWLGPMYRSLNDVGILTGLNLSTQVQFGYAFDWSLGNKTGTYNNGTHEFMLRYDFLFEKKEGIVSPRHF